MLTIGPAAAEDAGRIYELICDLENTKLPVDRFSEILKKQREDENYCCLVGKLEDRVVAVLNLRFEDQLHHAERIAEILEFAVDRAHRSEGIGGQIFKEAVRRAKEAGCVQIEVDCNQLRTQAHRFYLREGMHAFHYKFSKNITGEDTEENRIGK